MKIAFSPEPSPCKICGGPAPLHGVVDFTKNCRSQNVREVPLSGIPVYYRRCEACGFLFTELCDHWSAEEMARTIYNDGYAEVDPAYAGPRQAIQAEIVLDFFGKSKAELSVLDFGGGSGFLAAHLAKAGFSRVGIFDPMVPEFATPPEGRFNLITCFEVMEHVPDPRALVRSWKSFMAEQSLVFFSTLLLPEDFEQQGMSWWYVAPRNGHISIQSRRSLSHLMSSEGLMLGSFSDSLHVACLSPPDFASHFLKL